MISFRKMSTATNLREVCRYGLMMRNNFDFKKNVITKWFPGHMNKGILQVNKTLRNVDCVIEVHDARVPISGRNPFFEREIAQVKPHILVLNKADLVDDSEKERISQYYTRAEKKTVLFTNCKDQKNESIQNMVSLITNIVNKSDRYHRSEARDYSVMIMGIPNVGKSSLINAIRAKNLGRGGATKVGGIPGVTKSVLEKIKLCEDPLVYVYDTPGILTPNIKNSEAAFKLALVNTMKEHLVGEDLICDYLLYKLNSEGNHSYVEVLNLDRASDDIEEVLVVHALKNNLILKINRYTSAGGLVEFPNKLQAAKNFLQAYRKGKFGFLRLDTLDY